MTGPSEAAPDRPSTAVDRRLRAAADPSGFVPFDRFQEIALYDPEGGFYVRSTSPLGSAGAFYTAAHVHPLFGATIARRIRSVYEALGRPRPFRVVDVGPGDGTLASTVLPQLVDVATEYVLVERAPARRTEAEARARAAAPATVPVRTAESIAELGPFTGAVLANELLDAVPTRRVRWSGSAWRELGVRWGSGRWIEEEAPLVAEVPGDGLPSGVPAGTVLEISPEAEGWIRELADHLSAGLALLVDYGMDQSELIAAHPRGTLAAVRAHRNVEDPYDRPGLSDLSVFVNFDRVRSAARRAGLAEIAFRSQAEALGAWGFGEGLDAAVRSSGGGEAEVRLRLAVKNLLFGFERFRALELAAPSSAAALGATTSPATARAASGPVPRPSR